MSILVCGGYGDQGKIVNLRGGTVFNTKGEVYVKKNGLVSIRQPSVIANDSHYVKLDASSDPHDIFGNSIVSSGNDVVYTVDPDLKLVEHYAFGKAGYRHHVNDVVEYNGGLIYTLFSINGLKACDFHEENWRGAGGVLKSASGRISPKDDEVLIRGLSGPHSPVMWGGKLYYCNSMLGELCCDGEVVYKHDGVDQWTRGLLITEDSIYVGVTKSLTGTDGCVVVVLDHNYAVKEKIVVQLTRINSIVVE
jgi:hypothetical protein